jgi:hypothetical protein
MGSVAQVTHLQPSALLAGACCRAIAPRNMALHVTAHLSAYMWLDQDLTRKTRVAFTMGQDPSGMLIQPSLLDYFFLALTPLLWKGRGVSMVAQQVKIDLSQDAHWCSSKIKLDMLGEEPKQWKGLREGHVKNVQRRWQDCWWAHRRLEWARWNGEALGDTAVVGGPQAIMRAPPMRKKLLHIRRSRAEGGACWQASARLAHAPVCAFWLNGGRW